MRASDIMKIAKGVSGAISRSRGVGRLVFLWVLLLLVLGGLYWGSLLNSHREKERALETQTALRSSQLAQTMALQVQTLFSGLDFVAQNLVAEYKSGSMESFKLAVQTATQSYPDHSILQIAVANRDGQIVYSNLESQRSESAPASIYDREHFRVHADSPESGLFISKALLGRVSKTWTIQITRAIRTHGHFEGVVVVSVAPSYLSKFFRPLLERSNDVIMLLRSDGVYLARSHDENSVLGTSVPADREFLLEPQRTHGFYEDRPQLDEVDRYYAWHRIDGLPLVLSIGLDKNAVWAELQADIRRSLLANLLSTALFGCLVMVAAWLSLQQRKARAEAEHHAQLLRKLVEQVPGAFLQMDVGSDASLRFSYVSPSFYELHHMDPATHSNLKVLGERVIEPEDAQHLRAALLNAGEDAQTLRTSYRIRDLQGQIRHMQAIARGEKVEGGGVRWHGYVHDVTQTFEIQEALRASEERLRLTMAAVQDGVWEWNLAENSVVWDARCLEMLGHPAQARFMHRDTVLEWMHPNDRAGFMQHVNAHLAKSIDYRCEFRLRTVSGAWLWVEARGNACGFIEGKPTRMLGTHTDISGRVTQAQLLRGVFDGSAAAIFLTTSDRRFLQVNQRAQSMFGLKNESLLGKSLRLVHPDEASFASFSTCYDLLQKEGFVRREWRLRFNDGSVRWCELYGTPLDTQEPNQQLIWTVIDVEERYRAAQALRVAQRRLTSIIEHFPGGVMLQECLYGPLVAMNQHMCNLLGLPKPVTELDQGLVTKIKGLLPASMLEEPVAPVSAQDVVVTRTEQELTDGQTYEVHRIPLWEGDRSLGLFWMLNDITARKQRELMLEHLAATDTLTNLPNRRAFMAKMQQEWELLQEQHAQPGVLLMVDIDFFKRVNDTWGHAIGDEVLRHLANLLRQSLRSTDTVGRLGGEEFALLLPATTLSHGRSVAEALRLMVQASHVTIEQGEIAYTISIGVSSFDTTLNHMDEGLVRADAALYYAKRNGRNRACVWDPIMEMVES